MIWKVTGFVALAIFAVHFYLLARFGHIDPCEAAFVKLEYENITFFKHQRRELDMYDEQQPLFEYIKQRNIYQCYNIALF